MLKILSTANRGNGSVAANGYGGVLLRNPRPHQPSQDGFFVIRGHRAKTLKTISEQVSLLSSRGVEIGDLIDEMGFEAKEKEA